MKVLHLLYESEGDSFGIGGVGVRAYEIYGRLKERHDVTLLCKRYPGARAGLIRGIRHLYAGTESRSLTATLLSYALGCSRFVRDHGGEYDLIVEEFSPAVPTFCHALSRRPVILQVQGYTGGLYFRKYNPLYAVVLWLLERFRPRFYRDFIFISAHTADRMRLDTESRVEIISNGIEASLFEAEPSEGDYILYLGRIDVYAKGLDLLLPAFEAFHRAFPGVRLAIAGDGRDRKTLLSMIDRLPAETGSRVDYLGWLSGEAKKEVLSKALFAVHPTRHDVQGIAVLEAMACGTPVVVSAIPELSYVTECGGGVSFVPGNRASLAKAMDALMRSRDRELMGRRGRDWAKNLTWDEVALKYEKFLRKVYNTPRPARGA